MKKLFIYGPGREEYFQRVSLEHHHNIKLVLVDEAPALGVEVDGILPEPGDRAVEAPEGSGSGRAPRSYRLE